MVNPASTVPLIGPMQTNWRKTRKRRPESQLDLIQRKNVAKGISFLPISFSDVGPETPAGFFCPKGEYLYCKDGPCRCIKGARAWRWWEKRPSQLPGAMEKDAGFRFAGHETVAGQNLMEIAMAAADIYEMIDAESDLPEWVEHKLTVARVHLGDVKEFIEKNIAEQEAGDPEGVRFSGG